MNASIYTLLVKQYDRRIVASAAKDFRLFLDKMLFLNLVVGERYDDLEKIATLHQHKLSK